MSAAEQVDPSAFKPVVQIEPSEEVPPVVKESPKCSYLSSGEAEDTV